MSDPIRITLRLECKAWREMIRNLAQTVNFYNLPTFLAMSRECHSGNLPEVPTG